MTIKNKIKMLRIYESTVEKDNSRKTETLTFYLEYEAYFNNIIKKN